MTRQPGGPVAHTAIPARSARNNRLLSLVVAVVLIAPFVVLAVSLLGRHWWPSSDEAIEILHIDLVGTAHTPLLGVYSRFQWYHPGPALYLVLAPFDRLLGHTGTLLGAITINAASVVGTLVVARRLGRRPLVLLVGVADSIFCLALGPASLWSIWNPYLPVLPLLFLVLLCWGLAEGWWTVIPWIALTGTFVVQAHVIYAPLVLVLVVFGVIIAVLSSRVAARATMAARAEAKDAFTSGLRRRTLIGCGIVVALWLPVAIQQIFGHPPNLTALAQSVTHPTGPRLGARNGMGVMARELSIRGGWLGGSEQDTLGEGLKGPIVLGLLPVLACLALGALAWRRHAARAAHLSVLAVAGVVAGIVALSSIQGPDYIYLFRWSWVLAIVVWISIAWSACCLLQIFGLRATPRRRAAGTIVVLLTIVVLSAVSITSIATIELPHQNASVAVSALAPAVERQVSRTDPYVVDWRDDVGFGAVAEGLILRMHDEGYQIQVTKDQGIPFGRSEIRTVSNPAGEITVAGLDDIYGGWVPAAGAREIARFDPLTRDQRSQYASLDHKIRTATGVSGVLPLYTKLGRASLLKGAVTPQDISNLLKLTRSGPGYVVFLDEPSSVH